MKRILVIDDEEWLREMVNLALRQRGYSVIEAENGVIGVEKARKELPDLILCDVNMEKMDGYMTLSSLRNDATTASVPFILMTGLSGQPPTDALADASPQQFDAALRFSGKVARVKIGRTWKLIDKRGSFVASPNYRRTGNDHHPRR